MTALGVALFAVGGLGTGLAVLLVMPIMIMALMFLLATWPMFATGEPLVQLGLMWQEHVSTGYQIALASSSAVGVVCLALGSLIMKGRLW